MKLGIPGTGHTATTLAGAWSKTHEITVGSRTPGPHYIIPLAKLAGLLRTEAFDICVVR
jgi:predicted dinucleotide-binding enzyme